MTAPPTPVLTRHQWHRFGDALIRLIEGGWVQRQMHLGTRYCLYAALQGLPERTDWATLDCAQILQSLVEPHIPWPTTRTSNDPPTSISWAINWNDAPGRTVEEVIALLRQARALPVEEIR